MSTLAVVEDILREAKQPLSVREIVERAGEALPTRSKTPDTVVARDLAMDIKRRPEESLFIRTSPGRYTLRSYAAAATTALATPPGTSLMSQALGTDRAGTRPAPTSTQTQGGNSSMSA
jgi:hypothetical protein